MLVLLSALAAAAEPAWVQVFHVPATAGPPAEECSTKAKVRAPRSHEEDAGAPSTATSASPETPAPAVTATLDVDSKAVNPTVVGPDRARLQLDGLYDVSAVPLEPLRGKEADIARVREVFLRAAAGRGVTRVSFWGASHVAGEFWTGAVRRLLQDRFGDAGHGFVMPGPPWAGYRASDTNVCAGGTWLSDYVERKDGREDGRYGPAGMDVSPTADAFGWVQTAKSNPQGRAVSRFEVAFLREPGAGTLSLRVDDAPAVTVSAAGDTGPGMAVLQTTDGAHRLTVSAEGNVRLYGVWMERDTPGVVVDAAGVTGRTASSWQRWDPALMAPFLDRKRPDLVVLAYGTNEANDRKLTPESYALSLRTSLGRMRALMPEAACVLVGPSDRGKKVKGSVYAIWPATEWVARVQREVGPEFGCATWDLQAAMGGPGSMLRWYFGATPRLAAGDLIHLSAEGYKEVGARFVAALLGDGEPTRAGTGPTR
jgi:lysophospholipase L1-like esterase